MNPAAVRGPDNQLYLFPRLVARGNYSRIGIARVRFNEDGDPTGIERLGIALEPEAEYERRPNGGGCEDPRITFVEPLQRYVMTYTALSPDGPRIALALSEDLFRWKRIGLATFRPYEGIEFDHVDNKDASIFPVAIPDPSGQPAMAILHRPLFPGTRPEETAFHPGLRGGLRSGKHLDLVLLNENGRLRALSAVSLWLASPAGFSRGTVGTAKNRGWHATHPDPTRLADRLSRRRRNQACREGRKLRYSAGVMVLSKDHPRAIRYRSSHPILTPELPQERQGIVSNVVFPTGIDRRDDLGSPARFDLYYGMADDRIGVARLDVPDFLPREGLADAPGAKV